MDTQNIVNMWKNHYQQLLNSTNSSKSSDLSTTHLKSKTMGPHNKTDKFDEVKKFLCTVDLARSLSQKLKPDCAGGLDGLSANHIMFAHEIIYLHISIFFNLCLVHSYLPAACTNSVITPITKNKHGSVSAISNYRPIALPTVISKYFEHYILFMTSNFLSSVDNQFGFKPAHSTDMCHFLLKQAISQYNTHGSPVFVAFLDASKAFDKVNHHILFKKLTECNVPEIFVKLLANWYSSQLLCVRWGTIYSKFFTVSNGVRQGSILSPILFAVYMNQLSQTLNKLNVGCFIGQHCLNNILYADDICCIAPSCKGLQNLLDVCYEYAQSHDISFNCSKTKIMMFKTKFLKLNFVPKLQLGNCVIDYVEKVKYLGFLLTCDLQDDIDMYRQLRYVYGTANRLRSKFSDCSKNVKNYLFRTFMYSFYGSSIWSSYRQSTFHRLRVSYNNAYRILFNLRHRVSISSTLVQNNICTFQALIRKYVACFMIRCANSCNIWISSLVNSDDFLTSQFYKHFLLLHDR